MRVNGYKSKAAALRVLRDAGYKITGLLGSPESNPKVAKNGKVGVMSFPLHLAPADLSGFNTCPMASTGCKAACLHTAGNPAYMDQKERSRIAKTKAYFSHRPEFMAVLVFEIAAAKRKADRAGMECGVRLNATSDIPWERIRFDLETDILVGQDATVFSLFPDVAFYDYTKITKRATMAARGDTRWPSNYHLTFSKAEDNDNAVMAVLRAGGNVSVVFDHKAGLPEGCQISRGAIVPSPLHVSDWMVIDGDEHDFRPADPQGVIVGLKAKGDAKHDTSGFVVR